MYEIIKYTSDDLEVILKNFISLEDKLRYWENKTNKKIDIETKFSFNIETEEWEGELEVHAKEDK